ncbi:MAG TPA: type VI secretion system baseplate subunit TssE [Acidobacteriaceae bacterium]
MAKAPELLVTQSVLDRLSTSDDFPTTRAQSIRALRDSIKRNLEWLLNTRRPPIDGIEDYPLARHTVIYYGLLDLGSLSLSSTEDQRRLQQVIADTIAYCETRLTAVQVKLVDSELERKKLRFHIEARMQMKPLPEEIAFDTVLDLATGEYQVN